MRYQGTDVDGPTLDPERLGVRGRDLCEIIAGSSWVAALFHLLVARMPTPDEEAILDGYLRARLVAGADAATLNVTRAVAASGAGPLRAMIAGLMVERPAATAPELEALGFDADSQLGLSVIALLPRLLAESTGAIPDAGANSFIAAVAGLCRGAPLAGTELRLFEIVLTALHAGLGFLTPSVQLPRAAIGTGVPVAQAVAAGLTATGPYHLGACQEVMPLLAAWAAPGPMPLDERVAEEVKRRRAGKQPLPGMGHPIFRVDPRPPCMRRLAGELGIANGFLSAYDAYAAHLERALGLYPNVDAISAALLLTVGVPVERATGVLVCGRAPAMVAHALERKRNEPPFGVRSETARSFLRQYAREGLDLARFIPDLYEI